MLLMADVIIGNREVVWSLGQPEQCPAGTALGEPASKGDILMLSEWEHARALCPTLSFKSCSSGKGWQLEKVD